MEEGSSITRMSGDMERTEAMDTAVDAMKAMQAVEGLPAEQKEVLLLRYYHGFREAEVSEILGCPRGTVKSRLHQAVKAVRNRLKTGSGEGDS